MPLHVKQAGVWKPTKDLWANQAGVWKPVRRAFIKQGGVWKQSFQDQVVATITAHTIYANASNYFSAADWANPPIVKRLIIAPGVHCWSAAVGSPGLHAGYGRGGKLIIENHGYILGAGGAANSGEGGFAFYVDTPGITLINHGGIYGGGGGGGRGGNGGPGVWYSGRTVTEGPYQPSGGYGWIFQQYDGSSTTTIQWAGSTVYTLPSSPFSWPGPASAGGWTYYKGTQRTGESGGGSTHYTFDVYRQTTVYDVPNYTAGGAGGSGGRGYGFDVNMANVYGQGRGAGAAGGTNAGAGGYGGDGNTWGLQGGTGYAGAAGNSGGGLAGAAGGLGGHYIYGYSLLDQFTNYGTVRGRVA